MRLLIVEDEADLAEAIAAGLRSEGYAVDVALTVDQALEQIALTEYDLVTLDLGVGDRDGSVVCASLRAGGNATPSSARVLMVTARDSVEDRISGLDIGADDYLVKPFDLGELTARVRALLRRDTSQTSAELVVGDLNMDEASHSVELAGSPLALSAKEFALLRYFMLHPNEVLSSEELLDHVWDENADPFSHVVRVTVSNLRRKLPGASGGQIIETVVGVGYRLVT
jgi:DNA-binding response OmpR family regulator